MASNHHHTVIHDIDRWYSGRWTTKKAVQPENNPSGTDAQKEHD
jgi:hypothetical protein